MKKRKREDNSMKKKALVFTLLMAFVFACTACGGGVADLVNKDKDKEEPVSNEVEEEIEEEEPEEEEKPEVSGSVNTPSELSDDIYSFQISIDGTVYQFPMWAKDFAALGWSYTGDNTQTLSSNQYTVAETWVKDDAKVYTCLANLTMNSLSYPESMVAGITLEEYYLQECDWEIILPKGIQYGKATRDDVIAAYGTPSDEYDGDLYYKMTYEYDIYQEVNLYVYKESGVLEKIEIRNIVELEGGDNSVDASVPDVVKDYKAPTELGDDLYTYNVELEGHLYTFPCPVSELVANGFQIKESGSNMEIGADSYGWVELTYDNQSYRCIVNNYADYATIVENCFISTMESSIYGPDFDLVIPCDIKRGDTEKAVLDKIKNFNYDVRTSDNFTYYTIYAPGDEYGSAFEITIKDGTVAIIEVEYDD